MTRDENRGGRQAPAGIRGLIEKVITARNWQRRLRQHAVFSFWDEAVGAAISRRAQPVLIRGDVLWVQVSDSVWMQQLHLQKVLLLAAVNGRLQEPGLADIRFQLARSPIARPEPAVRKTTRPEPVVDEVRLAEFTQGLATVKNQEVRDALLRLWRRAQVPG